MNFGLTIKGTEKLAAALDRLDSAAADMVVIGLRRAVVEIHGEAVKSIQEHRSEGKRYGKHSASAPGYPPNTDTGRLVRSIQFAVNEAALSATVGTDLDYGAGLEFGTRNITARPWLGPAYRKVRPSIVAYFKLKVPKS